MTMNKIGLIIRREYITRVRKRSFIIMTILGPVLFAALIVLPAWLSGVEDKGIKEIAVVEYDMNGQTVPDSLQLFRDVIPSTGNLKFTYLNDARLTDVLKSFNATQYDGVLFLPQTIISGNNKASVEFYYRKPPSMAMEVHISESIEKFLFNQKLMARNISGDLIQTLETSVSLNRIDWKSWPDQKEDATDVKRGIGYAAGMLIYLFIFMFGAQVMQGILEEKTSRIVEVIISSVRPFQLMMGKIIGIALIGLTQFFIWIILTLGISVVAQSLVDNRIITAQTKQNVAADRGNDNNTIAAQVNIVNETNPRNIGEVNNLLHQLKQVNVFFVIGAFLFYFLGGYFLYGSLFAAIGAAVDNQTDTQQFMLPVTVPLILALLVMINTFTDPSGQLAVWFSIIPFTSPIVMMARISFGVPVIQLLLSAGLLILTFVGTTWIAGKIYRVGILMYGKKVTYSELWKWIKYKN
jgi:ABC-2 type transport system permease protein